MQKFYPVYFLLLCLVGCKQSYDIKVKSSEQSLLVVEGILNSGQGSTTFHLTRTYKLDDTSHLRPETGAQITVEGKDNSIARLAETGNGFYSISQLNIVTGQEYRLHIQTRNGKEYLSDYVTVKKNPPIDSISWDRTNDGVMIYANTHDPENNSRYYRWEYEETWEIHSHFYSDVKYDYTSHSIVPRPQNEQVYTCWKNSNSTSIILGSSAKLQSDVIYKSPLLLIPRANEKLSVRYSILVRQYTLTEGAYNYLTLMKKNTESIGSIFDPQPSELKGNLHCITDPEEQVIGYLTASPVQEKRIFIANEQVPDWDFRMSCEDKEIPNIKDSLDLYIPNSYLPYVALYQPFGNAIKSYMVSNPDCVDCTLRGGSTAKPSFW